MSDFIDLDEDADASTRQRKATLGQIMAYMWARWTSQPGKLAAFLTLFTIATVCDLLTPIVAGRLVEALGRGVTAGEADATYWYGVFIALSFGFYMVRNLSVRFWNPLAARNMKTIVVSGFADVQRFSSQWHADNFAGATVRRVSRAMWAYDQLSDTFAWFVLPSVVVLGGMTVVMFLKWPIVGAYLGAMILVFALATILLSRFHIQKANEASNSADTRIGAALADAVTGNPTVKAFGAEAREVARFEGVVEDWRLKATRTWNRFTDAWAIQNLLLWTLLAGLLGLVLNAWRAGDATPGDAAFALTAFLLISGYLRTLGENVQMLQRGFADIEDVVAYAREAEDVKDPSPPARFAPARGEVVFDRVGFAYRGQDGRLYDDFSLQIAPGETVALVGATGSGKSTFVKLVQRLYDVSDGAVRIDGQDVRSVIQASLRQSIALVPQDPALFHRSLFENIAYARPDASLAEVEDAARRARAHDFIAHLPKGYETEVGERGVKLSGGERQRVALARAFLADAPLLILDEATSSLDTETEREVQEAMKALMAGRTTILIAHRLSTIREADRILVFDRGRVVEQGTHASLVASGGVYARLHALSVGDALCEDAGKLEVAGA
jgi:ATP-binding cassette subfamily B protein